MGSPAGVCDTAVRVEDLGHVDIGLVNQLPQLGDLADLLEGNDLVLLVAIDGETGGVIATVFETRKTCFVRS